MNLSILNRKGKITLELLGKIKNAAGKFKTTVIKCLGTFPQNLKVDSPEGKGLIKKLIKTVEETEKAKITEPGNMDSSTYSKLLNNLIEDLEDIEPKNLGGLIVTKVIELFHIKSFFDRKQKTTKRGYNLYTMFQAISVREIIKPSSLLNYFENQNKYEYFLGEEPLKKQNFYDFLTFFYSIRLEFQRFLFATTIRLLGKQKIFIFYYDGSNFYTETTRIDKDKLDELDQIVRKGLRKIGMSKEGKRNHPIIGLGIISCDLGIPLFFTVFPGNEQESSNIQKDLDQLAKALGEYKITTPFLLGADAGLYSGDLVFYQSGQNKQLAPGYPRENNAYLIGRSINQVNNNLREWAWELKDYQAIQNKKRGIPYSKRKFQPITFMKSRVVFETVNVPLENGKSKKVKTRQKQIAIYSTKREYSALLKIAQDYEKARQLQKKNGKSINKKIQKSFDRYAGVLMTDPQTGKVLLNYHAYLDKQKKLEDEKNAGLFILTTSEIDTPDGKLVYLYRQKIIIENIFRDLKSVIKARPLFVWIHEHIVAHLDLAVTALILLNTLKLLLERFAGLRISDMKIQEALAGFTASPVGLSQFIITGKSPYIKSILQIFHIKLENTVMSFKKIVSSFKVKVDKILYTNK